MKWSIPVLTLAAGLAALPAQADDAVIPFDLVDAGGAVQSIGVIRVSDSPQGLVLSPALSGLPAGPHGIHVHENPDCSAKEQNGKPAAALGAGGHFDPDAAGAHRGPIDSGHRGDLPRLIVAADGAANNPMVAPRLKVSDLRGRSLVIHAGGDTYSDQPQPLGGGGARIACGIVPPRK
jgi:Cu-Zn family superoxide dismutase